MSSAAGTELTAAQITQASKSNLALAFVALSKERQADISVFYAFCRVVDDIADEGEATPLERQAGLSAWRVWVVAPAPGESALAAPVRALIAKYRLPVSLFYEIIAGCEMDVARVHYTTWEDLRLYCYRVASAVGLVSIEIFGYTHAGCKEYAEQLGLALQVTNIMRDVGEDLRREGRIYLPNQELAAHGVTLEMLHAGVETPEYLSLMQAQAARAEAYYAAAIAALPAVDRRSMVAAEIMRTVYYRILQKMRRDGFHTLRQRYRLSKPAKVWCIAQAMWRTYTAPRA